MYIEYEKINTLLQSIPEKNRVKEILEKSKSLKRLSLEETAILLSIDDPELLELLFETAKWVKNEIYGKRLVIFAPLYISNYCNNDCLYCAFRTSNKNISRKALTQEEIIKETELLLKTGQKRILLVAGESYPDNDFNYILKSIETVYSARDGKNNITYEKLDK